jgi:hypothetical protein
MGGQIMKKILVILVAVLVYLPAFSSDDWMETSEGKIECKDISLKVGKADAVLEDGQKIEVDFKDISSFSQNGKLYVKLRLFEDNKPTKNLAFMEQVGTWNELTLYRVKVQNLGTSDKRNQYSRYYLYNGLNYHLQLDDSALKNTCKEFGLNYAEM